MQTVGMIGLGALGVLFGQRLMANSADVRVLADKTRAEKYQKQGVTCNGAPVAFRYVTPEEAEPVDLMIFATKRRPARRDGNRRGLYWRKYAGFVCAQRRKQRRDSRGTLWRDQHFVLHGSGHGRGEGGQCADLCACGHDCAGRKTAGRNYAARAGRCGF